MDWQNDVNASEFVDSLKTDVFEERVYVFTPKGDVMDLPSGSTPIDFAYHIHTDIGHRCRGAKVNGRLVSLDYHLKTGDQVEILPAKRVFRYLLAECRPLAGDHTHSTWQTT